MDEREELLALRRMAELEAKERASVDPTGSTGQNTMAGVGKAIVDAGRGMALRANQAFANAPAYLPVLNLMNRGMEAAGLSPRAQVERSKAGIDESRKLDAPLMDTGGGITGNVVGNAALLAPMAAANTPLAAGVVGGMAGAIQPTTDTKDAILNTVLGAVGGAGGQAVANKVPALLQNRVNKAAATQTANAQKFQAARTAAGEGYVIPPADLEPGALSEAVSGLSGKIKTAQTASQRNQVVTDKLARQAIGLKPGDALDDTALQTIRNQAATQGYAPIRGAGTVQADQQFTTALDNILATRTGAARSFPGLGKTNMHGQPVDEIADLVNSVRVGQFDAGDGIDATRLLREVADKAYRQGDREKGKAAKAAADAVEEMLDRHLQAAGNPDALRAFRDARTLIAKTYSVQRGLNPQTGSVNANKLADLLAKNKPLTGELRTIAETAQAFPKATQMLKEAPKQLSPLDYAVAGGAALGSGNVAPLALLAARPLARNILLSGPVQARAMQQTNQVPFTQATQALLENRLAQVLLGPAGAAAGLQFGQ